MLTKFQLDSGSTDAPRDKDKQIIYLETVQKNMLVLII